MTRPDAADEHRIGRAARRIPARVDFDLIAPFGEPLERELAARVARPSSATRCPSRSSVTAAPDDAAAERIDDRAGDRAVVRRAAPCPAPSDTRRAPARRRSRRRTIPDAIHHECPRSRERERAGGIEAGRARMPEHAFCSPQKVCRFTLGRSPGLEGAESPAGRFTFPGRDAEWYSKRRPSLTVAEPRRICTGLPCYARRGHLGAWLYHGCLRPRATDGEQRGKRSGHDDDGGRA